MHTTWSETSVSLSTNPKPTSYSQQQPLPRTRQSHHHDHLKNTARLRPSLVSTAETDPESTTATAFSITTSRTHPLPFLWPHKAPPSSPTCSTTTPSLLWCDRAFSISFQNHATTASTQSAAGIYPHWSHWSSSSQRCWMGLRSGLCASQSRPSAPNWDKTFLYGAVFVLGDKLSCWNRKTPSPHPPKTLHYLQFNKL